MVAVTNYHKLCGFKTTNLILGDTEVPKGFQWVKIKVSADLSFFWRLLGESVSLHFQLLETISIPCLMTSLPSKPETSGWVFLRSHLPGSPYVPSLFLFNKPFSYFGFTSIIQNNLPLVLQLSGVNFICNITSPLTFELTYSQVLGNATWTSWEPWICLPHHMINEFLMYLNARFQKFILPLHIFRLTSSIFH